MGARTDDSKSKVRTHVRTNLLLIRGSRVSSKANRMPTICTGVDQQLRLIPFVPSSRSFVGNAAALQHILLRYAVGRIHGMSFSDDDDTT